jgi:hypothetical protein
MKPWLIYQVAVGPRRDLYEHCIDSVATYCQRHGIDHVVQREPILRITPKANHRSDNALRLGYLPIFEKESALAYLDDYDAVCVLDSDIYVRDQAPCIFQCINESLFYGVVERDMPLNDRHKTKIKKYSQAQYGPLREQADFSWNEHGAGFFNMGMMLMKSSIKEYLRGDSPQQFIQRSEFERFVNGEGAWRWSTDQTLLNYWIRHEKIPCAALDWRWNALYGAVQSDVIDQAWFVHFFLADHNIDNRDVRDIIQELDQ